MQTQILLPLFALIQDASSGSDASWAVGPAEWFGLLGPWVAVALFVVLLVRSLTQRHHYRAVEELDAEAQKAVHTALTEAEKHTVGEIVPVVLERSDRHPGACWLSAVVFVVTGTVLFEHLLPWDHAFLFVLVQLALGAVGYGLAVLLPSWKRMFVSEARATEMAGEQALQEFYGLGLHRTEARTGVLIFVSLLERRVIVLGDEGIAEKVDAELWQSVDGAILEGVRSGQLGAGLVEGVRRCGAVLAEHFPWEEGDRNQIPDRMVVRTE